MNEAKKETAPAEALEQVGTVMPYIIEALVTAPLLEEPIHFSKLDIKYMFSGEWYVKLEKNGTSPMS